MKKIFLFLSFCLLISGCTSSYKTITAQTPDLTKFSDGVYRGNYVLTGTPVKVTLDVNILNNQISNIKILEHSCSQIGKKAEDIIDSIIEKQSLEVDVVSGATASSISILKAVEDAL